MYSWFCRKLLLIVGKTRILSNMQNPVSKAKDRPRKWKDGYSQWEIADQKCRLNMVKVSLLPLPKEGWERLVQTAANHAIICTTSEQFFLTASVQLPFNYQNNDQISLEQKIPTDLNWFLNSFSIFFVLWMTSVYTISWNHVSLIFWDEGSFGKRSSSHICINW